MKNYFFKAALVGCLLILVCQPLRAAEDLVMGDELEKARAILAMESREAKELIATLNLKEAQALSSQMSYLMQQKDPSFNRALYIIQHIETLQATALAQKRLNNLLTVLGVVLGLLTLFFIYTLIEQRRLFGRLQTLVSDSNLQVADKTGEVYRGE